MPGELLSYEFMRNALIAILLIAPLFGLIGTLVVDNRMAFFSDSLGHSALTGIAIGSLIGLAQPAWFMVPFGIAFALLLVFVKNRNAVSTDTTIGVFSSAAIALGVVLAAKGGGFNQFSSLLVGDLLSVTQKDLIGLLLLMAGIGALWLILYNKMYLTSLSAALSHSRGVNTKWIETLFSCAVAAVVMVSVRWIGILIINAMLVLPAAAARNLSKGLPMYHALSIGLALVCGVLGLFVSYYVSTATGASIVLLLTVAYFLTLLVRKERST